MLFTLSQESGSGTGNSEEYAELCNEFADHIRETLRKSDIFMRYRRNQYFVVLMDVQKEALDTVVGNVIRSWKEAHPTGLVIDYEASFSEIPDSIPREWE